jgi:succinoglycan biosynthesis protein ExoO
VIARQACTAGIDLKSVAFAAGTSPMALVFALAKCGRCVVEPQPGHACQVRGRSISRVLELHCVQAMRAAAAALLRDHDLDAAAMAAQRWRTRNPGDAASFLAHLKDQAPLKAVGAALRDPSALGHRRMPIAARPRRLARPFGAQALCRSA